MLALDLFIVQDTGAYGPLGDHRSAGLAASLIYQPPAMRWRAVNVITNTPPRSQQRSPGPMQANGIVEPVITKAAKQLGIDQVAIVANVASMRVRRRQTRPQQTGVTSPTSTSAPGVREHAPAAAPESAPRDLAIGHS